ncbi:glycosyltransferase family 4 protein [Chitinophaga polysaccharea]|uniref:glycosyltransferase family 4 protein n=1 Tax=Chitinophaga polysaccharea TaxID=1293035 RepID=UPI00115B374C|nr:glycosyltransferase family 1 protein [Chitinophaga polysaccharea]
MPRFVIDCERMKYPNNGLYTYCSELGQTLMKLIAPPEELYFYLPSYKETLFSNQAHYKQKAWHKLWMPYSKDIQLWHTTYQLSDYTPASPEIKRVLTIHDLNFLYKPNYKYKISGQLAKVQRMINKADHIITISNYVKEDVLQHLEIGDTPLSVIYNGCDVKSFPLFNTPLYRPSQPFLFTIGTILPKKNFHVIPRLLKDNDYELIIAGNANTTYQKQILQEAALYGVQDRVKIIGPIDEKSKYWYFSNCSAFVFPSIAEGFGIPVIEAMHYGKPVFLSDKTSLPEIGGDLAYYFKNFDPAYMQDIFNKGMAHYNATQPMAALKKHADSFRWEEIGAKYLDIYRSLTA